MSKKMMTITPGMSYYECYFA